MKRTLLLSRRKILLLAIVVSLNVSLFAQKEDAWRIFGYDGKYGIVDTLGNEILPPLYWQPESLYLKKHWIFKNDNEGVIFSRADGKATHYEEVRSYHLKFQDSMYMRITDKGKTFLLNHHSDTRYALLPGRLDIETVGNYFYTRATIWPKSKSYKDKKTGKLMPPRIVEPTKGMALFKNPTDAKPVLEIGAEAVTPLWKNNNSIEDYYVDCDYIVFTTDKQIKIYDNNLKPIKTIIKPKEEYLDIEKFVFNATGVKVFRKGVPPSYDAPKALEYPLLIERKQDGQTQVLIEQYDNDKNPQFLFVTEYEVSITRDRVILEKGKKQIAEFDVNVHNGILYLPKQYLNRLNVDFTNKNENLVVDDVKDNSEIFERIDETASFVEGYQAMHKFIISNFKYPKSSKIAGIEGRVNVKFVVEKDGSISDIKIVKSLSKECDEEVIRIIKKMPKWSPGKMNGVAVRSHYTLPIKFGLD